MPSRARRCTTASAVLAGAFTACLWAASALAADPNAVAQDVLADPAFQSTFPGDPAADTSTSTPNADTPSESDAGPSDNAGESSQPSPAMPSDEAAAGSDDSATAGSGLDLRYLPLVLAAAGFLVLTFFLLNRLRRQHPGPVEHGMPAPRHIVATTIRTATPVAAPLPPGPLDDAEQLAASGYYAEAIHLVLLRFLAELRRLSNTAMADSLTSREILRRNATLPAVTREALGILIGAVELCHFGGRRGDETLFRHCVDAYMRVMAGGGTAKGAA